MYSPERVSTLTLSPMSTKSGKLTVAPVSRVAGLVPPPEAVSPRRPGSGWGTSSTTEGGSCRALGDLEHEGSAQLQVGALPVDEEHVDRVVGLGPAQTLGEARFGHRHLLVG